MNIVILGKNGQLGYELNATFCNAQSQNESLNVTSLSREDVDVTSPQAISALIEQYQPDIIFNAVAYTAVDKAESEKELAFKVNADAVKYLAESAKHLANSAKFKEPWIIHFSTDYVFNGESEKPYTESDPVNPLGVYGQSKYAGEQNLEELYDNYLIFRISWVYSWRANNFVRTMLRLGAERDEISVVDDQFGCPNYAPDIAESMLRVIAAIQNSSAEKGVYHLSSENQTNWYNFAREIMTQGGKQCQVNAIPSSAYPTPAKRPAYSVMSAEKFNKAFQCSIPDWQDSLPRCLMKIAQSA